MLRHTRRIQSVHNLLLDVVLWMSVTGSATAFSVYRLPGMSASWQSFACAQCRLLAGWSLWPRRRSPMSPHDPQRPDATGSCRGVRSKRPDYAAWPHSTGQIASPQDSFPSSPNSTSPCGAPSRCLERSTQWITNEPVADSRRKSS
jgi:hypothetical protein